MTNPDPAFLNRDELVLENLDLVGKVVSEVAGRYPRHVDRAELWNAGALGLVEASRRYDPASGIPFPRYAAIRIRGAIIDSTRSRDWASRSVRRRLREVNQARHELQGKLGRMPTTIEVADDLGITIDDVHRREADRSLTSLLHLDQPIGDGEEALADLVAETRIEMTPEEQIGQQELKGALSQAIRLLPPAQAEAITRSFLNGELLADIAADMGLTEARLSQIRAEAIASLQAYFATLYDEVEPPDPSTPGKRARAAYLERMLAGSDLRSRLEASND